MIVTKTPLRASLFGGGTDFASYFKKTKYGYGSVISASINKYVYIIVNKRFDEKIRIIYNGNELVNSVEEIKHNIIREALKIVGIEKGIEIVYVANIPMVNLGIGLASSSSLAVGVLTALHRYKKDNITKEQIVKEAIDLEINHLGQKIGIQDQYAVTYGGFNRYIFNKDDTVSIIPINKQKGKKLFKNLLLFYTGFGRDSSKIFEEQAKTTNNSIDIYDEQLMLTEKIIPLIKDENFDEIGLLLDKAWNLKKKYASGVSNEHIDNMYELALNSGALGGKILGAGGGGFLLLYVPKAKQDSVRNALKDYKEIEVMIENNGSEIVYED